MPIASSQRALLADMLQYLFPGHVHEIMVHYFEPRAFGSQILLDDDHIKSVENALPQRSFRLLYRASRDGFQPYDFHGRCDGAGPTLTVIRSEGGYIFGGYLSASWHSNNCGIFDRSAFLLTLHNPHGIAPQKFLETIEAFYGGVSHFCVAYGAPDHGPLFGWTGQVFELAVTGNKGSSRFGSSVYMDPTGYGNSLFAGRPEFNIEKLEVFAVSSCSAVGQS